MNDPSAVGPAPSRAPAPAHEGHNGLAPELLRSIVERIEQVESEIADKNDDKKEIYAEARAHGFDTKIIKKIVAERRKDHADLVEERTLLELYREALGEDR